MSLGSVCVVLEYVVLVVTVWRSVCYCYRDDLSRSWSVVGG